MDDYWSTHSTYKLGVVVYEDDYTAQMALVPLLFSPMPPDDVLSIGNAAGTLSSQLSDLYPSINIDGVELDGKVSEVGYDYFNMARDQLTTHTADGRYFLHTTDKKYDLITIDAYRQERIPFHLATGEFFQDVHQHLSDRGVAVINVFHSEDARGAPEALAKTMNQVFANVYTVDDPDFPENTLVVGSDHPRQDNTGEVPEVWRARVKRVVSRTAANMRSAEGSGPILTDDKAPVEWLGGADTFFQSALNGEL